MSTDALDDGGAEPAPWSDAGAKPAASDPAPPPADAESSVDYESASLVSPLKGVQGAESVAGLTSPSKYPLASPGKASAAGTDSPSKHSVGMDGEAAAAHRLWEGVSVGYYKLSRALRASLEAQKVQVASGRALKDKLVDVSLQLRAALGQKKADDAAIAELTKATHHAKTTFAKARRNAEVAEEVVDALSEEAEVLREKLLALHKANVDAESHARWRDQRRTARLLARARADPPTTTRLARLAARSTSSRATAAAAPPPRRPRRVDALPPPDLGPAAAARASPTPRRRAARAARAPDDPWRLSRARPRRPSRRRRSTCSSARAASARSRARAARRATARSIPRT